MEADRNGETKAVISEPSLVYMYDLVSSEDQSSS